MKMVILTLCFSVFGVVNSVEATHCRAEFRLEEARQGKAMTNECDKCKKKKQKHFILEYAYSL
jgi:hypothetical protein